MFRKIKKDIKNKFIFKQFSHQRKTQNAYFKKKRLLQSEIVL